jgi:serine/threonine protein kinase
VATTPDDVPGYELLGTIGAGTGATTVHRARERATGRIVALKVLRTFEAGDEAEKQRRFLEEGNRLLDFAHPNVVRAYDVGSLAGCAWIAQELVDGLSLQQLLDQEGGPLPVDAVLAVGEQLARALAALAEAEIVHRDVAPENVMVSAEGDAKLCDFGASFHAGLSERISEGEVPLGTVDYMSPEEVDGDVGPSPKSDVYGLGATLYRCLAGRTPHSGATLFARLRSIAHEPPPDLRELDPSLAPDLAELVHRFMERDGDDRPLSQDAAALLQRVADGLSLDEPGWEREVLKELVTRAREGPATVDEPAEEQVEPPIVLRLRGTDRTVERPLRPGEVFEVGRSMESGLSLPFGWISRKHARFERRGDAVHLVDLGSANGTTLNRQRLQGEARLATGDLVSFGKSRFEVAIVQPQAGDRRCALCGAGLDAAAAEAICERCRRAAEADRAAAEARLEKALAGLGLEVASRLPVRGLVKRYTVKARGRGWLASAVELGQRTAEALAKETLRARALEHPAVWPVQRVDVRDGVLVTLGPPPDGRMSLEAWVGVQGPLSPATALRVGKQLADAVAHAGARGVSDSLVRPDLVLLSQEGAAALLDVGLAPAILEAARARVGVGGPEPCWEAPELQDVRRTTPRAQVYALGATLSFALTGSPVAQVQAGERFENLPLTMVTGIPRSVAYLLARATSPDPAERPASVQALASALDALLAEAQGKQARGAAGDDELDEDELTRPIELGDLPPEVLFDP